MPPVERAKAHYCHDRAAAIILAENSFFARCFRSAMAGSRACALPSDPDFLLSFMSKIGEESDSDENFEGHLDEDDGPVAVRQEDVPDSPDLYSPQASSSYFLAHLGSAAAESPLSGLNHSPMQVADSPSLSPMHMTYLL